MEAPNKIYIRDFGNLLCQVWTRDKGKKKNDVDIEYIRKDLLLEWAKDNLLECEASNDETDYGRIDAYNKLIDKINSLWATQNL